MNDPVEALAAAIENHSHVGAPSEDVIGCGRGHVERCSGRILAALRASGFDVVPTGEGHVEQALWDKFTPGEKLAYGVGYQRRDPVPTGDAGLDVALAELKTTAIELHMADSHTGAWRDCELERCLTNHATYARLSSSDTGGRG